MVTMEETKEQVLTAQDRCDHQDCNAQAYYLTVFDTGHLTWCGHHFRKNEELFRSQAYYIIDQSESIS